MGWDGSFHVVAERNFKYFHESLMWLMRLLFYEKRE